MDQRKSIERLSQPKKPIQNARPVSSRSALEITRLKDNHFDLRIHKDPWIALGKTPDYTYNYDDSGLGFKGKKNSFIKKKLEKIEDYKEKFLIESEIMSTFKTFRNFKEFDNIKDQDVIITIEYCTNCQSHCSSTRHDEEKYYQLATNMKFAILNHFPIAKVFLKPLVFDPVEQSLDNLALQKRIGAFEIQICSKIGLKKKSDLLFSKLESKRWPQQEEVIDKVAAYIYKCDLIVMAVFDEEEHGGKSDNIPINIEIILRPYREKALQQKNTNTIFDNEKSTFSIKTNELPPPSKSRPESAINRPFSAFSNTSNKTLMSINRKMNEKQEKNTRRAISDEKGYVIFKDIPCDNYIIEIPETNDFSGERFGVNLFEFIENGENPPFKIQIKLKKQQFAYCAIELIEDFNPITQATINIVETNSQNKSGLYAHENISKSKRGSYEVVLQPGDYRFNINKEGYEEVSKAFSVKSGTNSLKIPMKSINQRLPEITKEEPQKNNNNSNSNANSASNTVPSNNNNQNQAPVQNQVGGGGNARPTSSKNIMIIVFDAVTNLPLANVNITLEEQTTKKSTVYKTNQQGMCNISQQNIVEGKLIIKDEQGAYFDIVEDYGPNKLNLYSMKDLSFPLIKKPNASNEIHVMVLTLGKKSMSLNVICPDNTMINQSSGDIEIENKFEQGLGIIKLKNLHQKNGIYRFFAHLYEPDIFNPQYIKLYVINEKEVNLLEVPKIQLKEPKNWDIGFVVAPYDHFIEINAPTGKEISKNFYLKEYQNLLNFIRNSKSVDLKTMLGFNHRDKLEANGDIFVSRDKIMNSLDKYGFEAKNIEHLFLSAIQQNGLYSFNKLEKKFSTIHPQIAFVEEKGQDLESGGEDEYLEDFN